MTETVRSFDVSDNEITPGASLEREKLLGILKKEKGISYAFSNHFVVIYKGGRGVYKNFGSYLDTDPRSMAIFLERGLNNVSQTFDLPMGDFSHVMTARSRGFKLHDWISTGTYTGSKMEGFPEDEWNYTTFSRLMSGFRRDYLSGDYPLLFASAGHEAIGHAFFQRKIDQNFLDRGLKPDQFIAVLNEGTDQYIGQTVCGVNSHRACANWLIDAADMTWWGYPCVSEQLDTQIKEELLEKKFEDLQYYFSVSLPSTFILTPENEFRRSEVAMQRGASFIKMIVDKFGASFLKQWAILSNRENYITLLEEKSGSSVNTIQLEWRKIVLTEMHEIIDFEQSKQHISKAKLARRKSIVDLIEKHT